MTPVFADTAFFVAFHNRRDALHPRAVECAARLTAPILTTEFILIEVANFFKRPSDRSKFVALNAVSLLPSIAPCGRTVRRLSCLPRQSYMRGDLSFSHPARTSNGLSLIASRFTL
jgi:hypothetical protein